MKKYRIRIKEDVPRLPHYHVQLRLFPGLWATVKDFYEPLDPAFAQLQAEELLEKLNEK